MTAESNEARIRGHSWAPVIPLAGGVLLLAALAFQLHAPVHIAGDGALKQYLIDSWLESGSVTSRVVWRSPEPWAWELWEAFHFPFEAPFVHGEYIVFPPFFPALSWPLYAAFGYGGLFVLPALSTLGLWLAVWGLLRRLNVHGYEAALALAIVVLSPLTYFGMMFWEHTPGLFALFAGAGLLMRRGMGLGADLAGGFLLAAAVMLRPELVAAAGILLVFTLAGPSRRIASVAGAAVGLALWAAGNTVATGTPLGLHARQELLLSGGGAAAKLASYYTDLGATMTASAAGAVGGLAVAACFLRREEEDAQRIQFVLLMMVGATLVMLPFMIPYSGEYMGFRRFELLVIPVGGILAGRLAGRYRWARPLLLALCALQAPRMLRQYEVFRWASGPRLAPVIEALRVEHPTVIVGDSQFTAIELSSLMGETALFWAPPPEELLRLLAEAGSRTELERAALVFWRPGPSTELTLPVPGRGPMRWTRRAGDDEGFAVFMPVSKPTGD